MLMHYHTYHIKNNMDLDTYQQLYKYLTSGDVPEKLNQKQATTFKKQATHYLIVNKLLHCKNTKTPSKPLKVIKSTELEITLHNLHSNILSGHFRIEGTYNHARSIYYWSNLYKSIAEYIKSFDTCQQQGAPVPHKKLYPIQVENPFN